jgi:hypothetical protein
MMKEADIKLVVPFGFFDFLFLDKPEHSLKEPNEKIK